MNFKKILIFFGLLIALGAVYTKVQSKPATETTPNETFVEADQAQLFCSLLGQRKAFGGRPWRPRLRPGLLIAPDVSADQQ